MVLFALASTAIVAGGFEWKHYEALLAWDHYGLSRWDDALLFLLIWGKSLVLMGLLLLPAVALGFLGFLRWARWVFTVGAVRVMCWLLLDLRLHAVTGNHLADYLHLAFNPGAPRCLGGLSGAAWRVGLLLLAVAGATLALRVICAGAARLLVERRLWLVHRGLPAVLVLVFCLPILVAWPGRRVFSSPILLEQLDQRLPLSIPFTSWIAPPPAPLDRVCGQLQAALAPTYARLWPQIVTPRPLDDSVPALAPGAPNVVVIVLESLRYSALSPEMMPRLDRWANRGLRLERHFAGSNCSHPGMMALLYGRTPHLYDRTLDARLAPQFPLSLRQAGYEATYIATTALAWERMEEYLDQRSFDRLIVHDDGTAWWYRDIETIADIKRLINGPGAEAGDQGGDQGASDGGGERGAKPKFIVAFLMATHFPYECPADRQLFQPTCPSEQMYGADTQRRRPEILNRYRNAANFDDEQVADLLGALDPKRNLIIITGDHGESFWEDGSLAHGSKLSEMQTRVPLVMVGPGVPAGRMEMPTAHADVLRTVLHVLAQRSVAVAYCPGRDLLALGPGTILPARAAAWDGSAPAAGADAPGAMAPSPAPAWAYTVVTPKPVAADPYVDIQVVRPEGKLLLRLALNEPTMQVLGFCDASGAIDPTLTPAPAAAKVWMETAAGALEQLAQ